MILPVLVTCGPPNNRNQVRYSIEPDARGLTCQMSNIELTYKNLMRIYSNINQIAKKNVQQVIIQNSNLTFVPFEVFSIFPNIRVFKASESNSNLVDLNSKDLAGATKLEELHLDNNKIVMLLADTFVEALMLRHIGLSNNRITYIEDRAFSSMTALKTLHLQNNLLETISSKAFYGADNLEVLTLQDNNVKMIQSGAFLGKSQLYQLNLQHNDCISNEFKRKPGFYDKDRRQGAYRVDNFWEIYKGCDGQERPGCGYFYVF